MKLSDIPGLLKETAKQWYDDNTFQLGAALAYYAVFSLAPMLIIAIAIAGVVFGEQAARGRVAEQLRSTVGPQVADAVQEMLRSASETSSGNLAAVVSVVILLFSATAVFGQLQAALNTIWGVKPRPDRGWLDALKDRFWSFVMVLGLGLLLLASLVMSALLTAVARFWEPDWLPGGVHFWQALNYLISFGLITLLFAMIYKVLPDVEITWHDVWVGAIVTALLFTLGTYLIGLYLAHSSWISAYGAAGSVIVVLLWFYYSSQVLLLGAEFTQVYANRYGRPTVDADRAVPVTREERTFHGLAGSKGVAAHGSNCPESGG
jgi:membrane protein